MPTNEARFRVGQLVHHALFSYRGVIYDADPVFMGSEAWYEANALLQLERPTQALIALENVTSGKGFPFSSEAEDTYETLKEMLGMSSSKRD